LNGIATIRKSPLTPEALDLWWGCMADWSIEDFKAAAIQVLKTSEFMPMPKHFEDLRKALRPTAIEAWAAAVSHAASSAYRRGPIGDHRIDMLVRGLGGYIAIAMCEEDKLHFLERRFCEHFDDVQDSDDVRKSNVNCVDILPAARAGDSKNIKRHA
jgi:hypothetical protein